MKGYSFKNNVIRIILSITIIALSTGIIYSGDTMTLTISNAIDLALENDLSLKQMEQDVKIAGSQLGESASDLIPSVGLTANYTYIDPNTVNNSIVNYDSLFSSFPASFTAAFSNVTLPVLTNVYPDNYSAGIGLSYTLPIPFSRGSKIIDSVRLKQINLDLMKRQYEDGKKEVIYKTLIAFYDLFLTKENITLSEDLDRSLSNQLKNINISYEKGSVSEYDKISIEVQYKNNQPRLLEARDGYNTAKLTMIKNLGLKNDTNVEFIGNLMDSTNIVVNDPDESNVIQSVLSNNMNYIAILYSLQIEKLSRAIIDDTKYPALAVFANINDNLEKTNSFVNDREWTVGWNVGLQFSLPVNEWFPFSKTANSSKENDETIDKIEDTREQFENNIDIQVNALLSQIDISKADIVSSKEGLTEAKLRLDIANERYSSGSSDIQGIIDSQASYTQAQVNWLKAVYSYYTSILKLKRITGDL